MFNNGREMSNFDTDTVNSNHKDERLKMSNACMIEENGEPETDTVKSNDKDERLKMSNACMIEQNGGPKTDTVKSNDKDERLEMSNACMIEQNGGPKTDTVKSNDKDERLEMSNACMIEQNGGPKTDTVKSNDKDERLEMSNACMIEQNGGPDESNFNHSGAQVFIRSLSSTSVTDCEEKPLMEKKNTVSTNLNNDHPGRTGVQLEEQHPEIEDSVDSILSNEGLTTNSEIRNSDVESRLLNMRNTEETNTVVNIQMRSTTARDSTTKYFCGNEVFPSEQTEARQDLISVESRNMCVEEEDRKVLSVNEDESSKIGKGNRKMLLPLDELSPSISRTWRMLLYTILWITSSYMCIALKCNESSIKDKNSLNLHGCEVGCYNDIKRNGLIIDFKPWLEFGDFTRLRDDILQKIHSCVKKGILIFPDWVRVIWNGKTPIQLKRINKIGEGGIGVVYRQVITDGVLSFIVASKVIPFSEWRNEEAEALISLQDCSFVPKLYGIIKRNGNVELLEELMDGKTLSSWHGKDLVDVVVLFKSLLQKISVLHKKGLYHQDLKVSNVMVTDPSDPTSVVIIDFGSTIMRDSKRNHKRPITNSLAPPEKRMTYRAIRQSYDERTKRLLVVWDSWSLGIILFYLLTGKTMSLSHDVTQANLNFTREKIRKCIYNMTSRFGEIPDYIRDILIGLTEPDHRRRMTPDMILDMFDREIFICIH